VSNKSNLRLLVVLLFAAFATAALAFGDFGALAQNANSSTTGDASMQNGNSNGNMGRRGRGRRRRGRGRRRAASTAAAVAAAEAGATGGASQTGDVSGEQTDLSGTYTGHVKMSGGHDMDGDGTLTITGNQFSLEAGGMTHNGRVYAVTTRGYTGASLYFGDMTDSTTNTPVVATVRARKNGDRLWLSPVPGTQTKLTFGSGGGGGGRRGRRGRRSATMAPPAEATGDASATGDATTGAAAGTGNANANTTPRRRRGSRRRRGTTNTNANMNTNTNTGDNSNATPPM
jgi:hypothetical protein